MKDRLWSKYLCFLVPTLLSAQFWLSSHGSQVAISHDLLLETLETRVNLALGKQWSCDYLINASAMQMLPYANLCYQEALDWHKWAAKGVCTALPFVCTTDTRRMQATCSFSFCKHSYDRSFIVAKWNDLHFKTKETRAWNLLWASNEHVTTWSMSQQRWCSPKLTFGPLLPTNF